MYSAQCVRPGRQAHLYSHVIHDDVGLLLEDHLLFRQLKQCLWLIARQNVWTNKYDVVLSNLGVYDGFSCT